MNRTTKALLFDLDGTVLPQDDRPTATVIEAVRAASRLIPVAIASGRVQDDVCHYARLFGLSTPQVADNGAAGVQQRAEARVRENMRPGNRE